MAKLSDLSPGELQSLATRAGTSVKYLRHLLAGRRQASAEMAGTIEDGSGGVVGRETLCPTCNACPYLKACRKAEK